MKQPQPGLLFTVNKVKERNTALGSAACPSVRLKGCMMGSSNKERCQERHGICKKTTTLQNDLFIPYLMVFVLSPQSCVVEGCWQWWLSLWSGWNLGFQVLVGLCCAAAGKKAEHMAQTTLKIKSLMQVTRGTLRERVVLLQV